MNEHLRLPPRRLLARPSLELGRRMDALFASATARSTPARGVRRPWRTFLASAGLAAALALCLIHSWRAAPRSPEPATGESLTLPADLATTLLPPEPTATEYSLSIRSY